MFRSYIESIIRSYLSSPSYAGGTPTSPIRDTGLFDAHHHHLAVRKIANGFLMAYYDGGEPVYCATEKDLADQIISKAVRSKMDAAQNFDKESPYKYTLYTFLNAKTNPAVRI